MYIEIGGVNWKMFMFLQFVLTCKLFNVLLRADFNEHHCKTDLTEKSFLIKIRNVK